MPKLKAVEKPVEQRKLSIDGPGVKVDRFSPDNEDAYRMLVNLSEQPKIRTRIPREPKEPIDACATVILDSLRINIRKGVSVDLPEQIADIIEDSYYQTEAAMAPKIKNPFSGASTEARLDMKSDTEMQGF